MYIGVDIEEVKRFEKYVKDKIYLERVFADEEISYCMPKKRPAQHLAARFAAKEAVWKALSAKNKNLVVTDISIKNTQSGKPEVYIKNKRYKKIDVSLSHTDKYVVAAAVVF
ncbi:MAG: holo-ACP synthase [Endomicrobia bacterium]|nr:holo-ACP synthase [Endomicrobiia bacterium]MCL2507122.1 holo-ACP synthase [Endomicrobiia bacterium]